jgi:ABC-type nitrate/sulfonate/bicarbonate transport system ATPase subunit
VTHDVDEAVFISDRVVVMTNRPGTVKEEVTVDLPRPRAFELQATPGFLALRSRVLSSIREETLRSDVSISPGGEVRR